MNLKLLLAAGALATGLTLGAASSSAQTMPMARPGMYHHLRGERASARNLIAERRKLEGIIDSLQRDRHDYGGHRETAIDLLQRARAELDAAIQYDATHPGM